MQKQIQIWFQVLKTHQLSPPECEKFQKNPKIKRKHEVNEDFPVWSWFGLMKINLTSTIWNLKKTKLVNPVVLYWLLLFLLLQVARRVRKANKQERKEERKLMQHEKVVRRVCKINSPLSFPFSNLSSSSRPSSGEEREFLSVFYTKHYLVLWINNNRKIYSCVSAVRPSTLFTILSSSSMFVLLLERCLICVCGLVVRPNPETVLKCDGF